MRPSWRHLRQRLDALPLPDDLSVDRGRPILWVDIERQRLLLIAADERIRFQCPVSTAAAGAGQREGSFRTPTGWHRIDQKIGQGEPPGRVFRGRRPTAEICLPQDHEGGSDPITTRILRLDGLEPGHNRGAECDSRARCIYIHGTPDEARIGQPVSRGCIRLGNADMLALFERVEAGDPLLIESTAGKG
jgi:UDP-N-acetylmuramate--alanine ligase